eukprot:4461462-Pyramimonas_sp.AAC.1
MDHEQGSDERRLCFLVDARGGRVILPAAGPGCAHRRRAAGPCGSRARRSQCAASGPPQSTAAPRGCSCRSACSSGAGAR